MTDILIVDENPALRRLLCEILEAAPELGGDAQCHQAVGVADALNSLDTLDQVRPDWVLIDASTSSEIGLRATQTVHDRWPAASIVVISDDLDPLLRDAALQAGARHCWSKERLTDLPDWIQRQQVARPQSPAPQTKVPAAPPISNTTRTEPKHPTATPWRRPRRFRQWLAHILREAAARADESRKTL